MSANFVTQLVAEKPRCLLITPSSIPNSELGAGIKNLVDLAGLDLVQSEDKALFSSNPALPNSSGENLEFYRVIWVCRADQKTNFVQKIAVKLRAYSTKLFVVIPIKTTFQDGFFESSVEAQDQQNKLSSVLNTTLPEANLIYPLDLLDFKPANPFFDLLKNFNKNIVYDPQAKIFPHSSQSLIEFLGSVLFRPSNQGRRVVVRGSSLDSTDFLSSLRENFTRVYGREITTISHPTPTPPPINTSFVDHQLRLNLDELRERVFDKIIQDPELKPGLESKPNQASELGFEKDYSELPSPASPPSLQSPKPQPQQPQPQQPQPQQPGSQQPGSKQAQKPPSSRLLKKFEDTSSQGFEKIDVETELDRIFKTARTDEKLQKIEGMAQDELVFEEKSKRKTGLFYTGLAFIGMGLGVLVLMAFFIVSQVYVKHTLLATLDGYTQSFASGEEVDWTSLQRSSRILEIQVDSYGAVFDLESIALAEGLVQTSTQLIKASQSLEEVEELGQKMIMIAVGASNDDFTIPNKRLNAVLKDAHENLSLLELGLSRESLMPRSADGGERLELARSTLTQKRRSIDLLSQLQPVMGSLVGESERRVYALVLKNNQELRPTGGFVQAIALLTFESGMLVSSRVYSSYEIDAQLRGVVVPPDEVGEFLNENRWFLRDSNWDPDFPSSAERIGWFIERSLGTEVDGVLGMTLFGLQNILRVVGPLELPEFNEVLTDRNLMERMEFHSEVILADDSDRRDYSSVVLERFLQRLTTISPEKTTQLAQAFGRGLRSSQILFSTPGRPENQTLSMIGWDGSLMTPGCPTQLGMGECVVSTVAQVEANVGVNKANYYLERSIDHRVTLRPQQADHKRLITLKNTAQSSAWPKGAYRVYTRFYIDQSASDVEVLIDDSPLEEGDLNLREEGGRLVVGFLASIPIQSEREVVINYTTPLPQSNQFSYAFFNQKQPGTGLDRVTVRFAFEGGLQPTTIAPQADVGQDEVIFRNLGEGHGFVGVGLRL